jgi:hypothetical protein
VWSLAVGIRANDMPLVPSRDLARTVIHGANGTALDVEI